MKCTPSIKGITNGLKKKNRRSGFQFCLIYPYNDKCCMEFARVFRMRPFYTYKLKPLLGTYPKSTLYSKIVIILLYFAYFFGSR